METPFKPLVLQTHTEWPCVQHLEFLKLSKIKQNKKGRRSLTQTTLTKGKSRLKITGIQMPWQELNRTHFLFKTTQYAWSMFVHREKPCTLIQLQRWQRVSMHVCVYTKGKCIGSHVDTFKKYSWEVKLFRRCVVLRVFQEHTSTQAAKDPDTYPTQHIEKYLRVFSQCVCILTGWCRQMCKIPRALPRVEQ